VDHYSAAGPYDITAKHDQPLTVYVMHKDGDPGWVTTEPHPQYIEGIDKRVSFLVKRLHELEKLTRTSMTPVEIFEQSALSTFSVGDYDKDSQEYRIRDALEEQRELLSTLATRGNVQLTLIINPNVAFQDKNYLKRVGRLIDWMEPYQNADRIQWAESDEYFSANQLVVANHLIVDGFSGIPFGGLNLNRISYESEKIDKAVRAFRKRFQEATYPDKETVIRRLKDLHVGGSRP
jgi:hypothetical protein